jgi:16S rRNA processing protein RimM
MNDDSHQSAEPLVTVARAVKTKGLKGELVADLLTDFPDRFGQIPELIAVAPNGMRQAVSLEHHSLQNSRVVLKLAGYDSIESASTLVGYEFAVPESERVQLPEGHFYDWELEGCEVENVAEERIGVVREVMRAGGAPEMLVVENAEEHRYLIPMAQSIVVEIDIGSKRIRIDPPEGLLEL